jgi:hypothetical protein
MCYTKLFGVDGETLEATASAYSEGKELPEGQWSVLIGDAKERVIMSQEDMPEHWRKAIEKWSNWGKKNI